MSACYNQFLCEFYCTHPLIHPLNTIRPIHPPLLNQPSLCPFCAHNHFAFHFYKPPPITSIEINLVGVILSWWRLRAIIKYKFTLSCYKLIISLIIIPSYFTLSNFVYNKLKYLNQSNLIDTPRE